jgi:pimeloyl-ACP methyl ester carboxylesterase
MACWSGFGLRLGGVVTAGNCIVETLGWGRADVGSGRIDGEILQYGTGESLLLIHGKGSSGADWEFQVRALERHFRVIVPDLPGSGYSPAFDADFCIGDCATLLWALLDHLRVSSSNIAGFSFGGAILRHPDGAGLALTARVSQTGSWEPSCRTTPKRDSDRARMPRRYGQVAMGGH